jgi:DDE superfamily endonuclease
VDGTLLPTGQRTGQQGQGPYSGKRHKAGMNVQVISDGWGRLVDVSDPTPGSMHDARSFAVTGLAEVLADRVVLADLGFVGCGVSTPVRKPPGGELWEMEKANNRAHASARAPVERTIALFKQWKVLGTGYRGPLARFPKVIQTVVALEKFRIYENPF